MKPQDEFDLEYVRLSNTGACDGFGGMEWERVKSEWIAAGRPSDTTIEAFIRERANWMPREQN